MAVTSKKRCLRDHSSQRGGFFAVREMLLLTAVGVMLVLSGSWMMKLIANDFGFETPASAATSERGVFRLSLDRDGQKLWAFRPREGVLLKNIETGELEDALPLNGLELSEVAHSRDSRTSLLCAQDGTIVLYREDRSPLIAQASGTELRIVGAAVSIDGSTAICLDSDGSIRGWRISGSNAESLTSLLSATSQPSRMCMDALGTRLFVAFADGSAAVHDVASGRRLREFPTLATECAAAVWSHDGRVLARGDADGTIGVYEAATGTCVWRATVSGRPIALTLSPDGKLLAGSTQTSNAISVWKWQESSDPSNLNGHSGIVFALDFSPDSNLLYSGGLEGTICEWSVPAKALVRTLD